MRSYIQMIKDGHSKNGIDPKVRQESFQDFLTMKAISGKRIQTFGNAFGANAGPVCMGGHSRDLVRNLCVRLDALRLAELDALTDVLDCSKQEFVLEALASAIAKAIASIEEHGLAHVFEEKINQRLEKAELSFRSSPDGAHQWLYFRGELIRNKDWDNHKKVAEGIKDMIDLGGASQTEESTTE